MRILIEASVLEDPATGIGKVLGGLYQACVRLRPDLRLTSIHRRILPGAPSVPGRVARLGSFLSKRQWERIVPSIASMMLGVEIVHFPWNGRVSGLLGKKTVVTTLHDVLPLMIPGYFGSSLEEQVYRNRVQADIDKTDLLVTDSEYSRNQIAANFRIGRELVVIPLASALPTGNGKDFFSSGGIGMFFLYVGGYNLRKGLVPFLRLFLDLKEKEKLNSRLAIAGQKKPVSKEFDSLIKWGTSKGWIVELRYVPDLDLASLYRKAIALVYPSRFEGFGLPPLEAMSLGCPVITTRGTAIPEVCGEAVYYVDPVDQRMFAQALVDMETLPNLRTELSEKGMLQAEKFSWDHSAKLFLNALDDVRTSKIKHTAGW